jgi:tetratricopeptide (TPR) repeat protein
VAKAVTAYLAGVQERLRVTELERAAAQAREAEAKAKAKAERRARRVTVSLAASVVALLALAGGVGWWWREQQAEAGRIAAATEAALSGDLEQATAAAERGDDIEARAALERADGRLTGGGFDSWRDRVHFLRGELDFVAQLEEIRIEAAKRKGGEASIFWKSAGRGWSGVSVTNFDYSRSAKDNYKAAFFDHRLHLDRPEEAAARIQASPVRARITAALDDWAVEDWRAGPAEWARETARLVDPDGPGRFLRDETLLRDVGRLKELARRPEVADWVPANAVRLARALDEAGQPEAAVEMLREVQRRHRRDFWVNFELANCLTRSKPPGTDEAVGFYQVATALRPEISETHLRLGNALHLQRKLAEAEVEYREALRLSPHDREAHNDLGNVLANQGRTVEAEREFRRGIFSWTENDPIAVALRLWTDDPVGHNNLGAALSDQGRAAAEEAEVEYRKYYYYSGSNLGNALRAQGKAEEAAEIFHNALRERPDPVAHNNLGVTLSDQGRAAEAEQEFLEAEREIRAARINFPEVHISRGMVSEFQGIPNAELISFPEVHINLGVVLGDQGRLEEAEREFREALRLSPDYLEAHHGLACVLRDLGRLREALQELQRAHELGMRHPSWPYPSELWVQTDPGHFDVVHRPYPSAQWRQDNGRLILAEHESPVVLRGERHPRWPYPSAQWLQDCEELIRFEDLLPIVLRGEAEPSDAAASLRFARVCGYTRRYGAAARFYAAAFAFDAATFSDPRTGVRYNAARVAALAGCGQENDAPPGDADRARLRVQALEWLRADLAFWKRGAGSDDAKDVASAPALLRHWRVDPDLAGVRDADALDKLPEDERGQWRQLWDDVDALVQKTVRARLRGRALEWLRRGGAAFMKRGMHLSDPQCVAGAQDQLRRWREDYGVARVPDADALDKLPDAEREEWRQFWDEVDALLQKTTAPK